MTSGFPRLIPTYQTHVSTPQSPKNGCTESASGANLDKRRPSNKKEEKSDDDDSLFTSHSVIS